MNFIKTGQAAVDEQKKADAERKTRYAPFRFYLKEGEVTRLTFLDGILLPNGLLNQTSVYEHMIARGPGQKGFDNYSCTKEQEQCPICEEGDFSNLNNFFTVLDHRPYENKDGKTVPYQKRLYACRGDTIKRLQAKATMYGGLVGVTFEVRRIGKTSPGVGSDYDYVSKDSIADIASYFGVKIEEFAPKDYEKEITYLTADELRKIGFGTTPGTSIGSADSKAFSGLSKPSDNSTPSTPTTGGSMFGGQKAADTGAAAPASGVSGSIFGGGQKPFNPANEM